MMSTIYEGRRPWRFASLLVMALMLLLPTVSCAAQKGAIDKEEFRAVLREVLAEDPDIILEVLKERSEDVLDIAQQGNALRKRKAMVAQWRQDTQTPKKPDLKQRAFRGGQKAPVTIVSYSDFTCPYCRQAEYVIVQILKKYGANVRVTFKPLPKDTPESQAAAKLSTAAFMLDPQKGWKVFDALFDGIADFEHNQDAFVKRLCADTGLDQKALAAKAESEAVQSRLDADREEADGLGISGTPYFLVNDLLIRGAVSRELFEEAVEMALDLKKKK
ncbi:thioredoxin domain-containing protein [Desulfovibrio sp. OttesenSCG-928-G15]|nr:thioredoxin domain-containing protein [Desulfovibrio sp. OttesenSCG-928-G15]